LRKSSCQIKTFVLEVSVRACFAEVATNNQAAVERFADDTFHVGQSHPMRRRQFLVEHIGEVAGRREKITVQSFEFAVDFSRATIASVSSSREALWIR
jgi:hypothetical protein